MKENIYQKALDLYRQKNYNEAFPLLEKICNEGYATPAMMCMLGDCYKYGQGTEQDIDKGIEWIRKAAETGDPYAQNKMGDSSDYASEEAAEWYRKAAEQGYAEAQRNLADCYIHGEGVPENYEEAVKWYKKAAAQNHVHAIINLYRLGERE